MEKTIILNPGESAQVSFNYTPTEVGIYNVAIDGLVGEFQVVAPETPTTDYLNMSESELLTYLASGHVASTWWDLPPIYRRELALKIIHLWSVAIGPTSYHATYPTTPPWNPFFEPPLGRQEPGYCHLSFGLRYFIFNGTVPCPPDLYYYRNIYDSWESWCFPTPFHLPVYYGGISHTGLNWAHIVCAIQIAPNVQDFNSWIFFQYETPDIRPGNEQMPRGSFVKVDRPIRFSDTGLIRNSERIADWEDVK